MDVHHVLPIRGRLFQTARLPVSRIGHKNIDPAEVLLGLGDHGFDSLLIAYVENRSAGLLADQFGGFGGIVRRPVSTDNGLRAVGSEALCQCASNARSRSGNDRYLVGYLHWVAYLWISWRHDYSGPALGGHSSVLSWTKPLASLPA